MSKRTLLRLPQVEAICGLKKSAIYAKMKDGDFPISYSLGSRCVAWRSDEIEKWINELPVRNNENRVAEEGCDE